MHSQANFVVGPAPGNWAGNCVKVKLDCLFDAGQRTELE